MNKKIQIVSLLMIGVSQLAFSQIQEEKLILKKKREPEVKKIEKKKTSVETIKNYPPEEKSQNPVQYTITDVPAVSDFKTSTIQGVDVAPKFEGNLQRNYAQFGMGNYGKFMGDANISTMLQNDLEVGLDAHALSTTGLKKDYPWNSRQSAINVGAYLNGYGEKGKFNFNADYGVNNYNYYGIYALTPEADIDIKQKVSELQLNGYYDFYANEILNDVRVKTSFLTDNYDAKESQAKVDLNLSKHSVNLSAIDSKLNFDLGLGIQHLRSEFTLRNQNYSQFLNAELSPKITFMKGDIQLMVGSNFSFVNSTFSDVVNEKYKTNKTYWFPKAEFLFTKNPQMNFYAGVDGGLEMNSYSSLLKDNPYLIADQVLRPTETKYNVYFGLKGDFNEMIKYDFTLGYAKINNIVFFEGNDLLNDQLTLQRPGYDYANTFSTLYDNGTLTHANINVQYFPIQNLTLDAGIKFENYDLEHHDEINYVPMITANVGAKYSMLNQKLHLGLKTYFVGNRTANSFEFTESFDLLDPSNDKLVSTEYKDDLLKYYADINLSAEYKIHKNFSVFALANNLLNNKYQTFKGYKVLGTQILGGIKVTF